ncbi:hypothetical protein AAC387_Pa02g1174 [Persea americana]
MLKLALLLCFIYFNGIAQGGNFNVMENGAKADGKTDDAKAFEATWKAACESSGPATILIPKGTYLLGAVKFNGPCKAVPRITIKMEGYLKADTDLNKFPSGDWVCFAWTNGLTISGTGTFDGQGAAIWHLNDCQQNEKCKLLPINLKFVSANNTVVNGITSLNSKNFHFGVVESHNFKVTNLKIVAPGDSPNTDGMHVERCSDVTIQNVQIATGDDCISLGQGLSNVLISSITCGPGHGISIGSLGKYPGEKDVTGLIIRDSTITGTMNGVRIKSWANSPSPSAVSNVTFENIVLKDVSNPIIVDQLYCPSGRCPNLVPSLVKISDVSFKNIRGTYLSDIAVTLHCSLGFPCQNLKFQDINLQYRGGRAAAASSCMNVKAVYSGTQVPGPCPA